MFPRLDNEKELTEDLRCTTCGIRVKWTYSDYWSYVTVWEIAGHDGGSTPVFHRRGAISRPDLVASHHEAERYLIGHIKWDGCSEFTFAPDAEDGAHVHWCGPNDYRNHFRILETIYRRAQSLMTRGNSIPWDKL